MLLHIFNPEHDLALAADSKSFTAPHAGRELRADFSFIPAFWAEQGDLVLVDDIDLAKQRLLRTGGHIPPVEFITIDQLSASVDSLISNSHFGISPWGWDKSLKYELLSKCDALLPYLPDDDRLEAVRQLSSRQWTAAHLQKNVLYCKSIEEAEDRLKTRQEAVLKAPWSSSGRGIRFYQPGNKQQMQWVAHIVRCQGGIIIEPRYKRVKDFGMEFEAMDDGSISYCGLSLFDTVNGNYTGNILSTEEQKVKMMEQYISGDQLEAIRKRLVQRLQKAVKGVYAGPFGVDMMVYAKDKVSLVHPEYGINDCVEINWRRTMGHVALSLSPVEQVLPRIMNINFDGSHYHLSVCAVEKGTF